MDLQAIQSQIVALLALKDQGTDRISHANEMVTGTMSLLSAVYGHESTQVQVLTDTAREFRNSKLFNYQHNMGSTPFPRTGELRVAPPAPEAQSPAL